MLALTPQCKWLICDFQQQCQKPSFLGSPQKTFWKKRELVSRLLEIIFKKVRFEERQETASYVWEVCVRILSCHKILWNKIEKLPEGASRLVPVLSNKIGGWFYTTSLLYPWLICYNYYVFIFRWNVIKR